MTALESDDVWSRDRARDHVMDAYGKSVAMIIETGRRLAEAKAHLPRQFLAFVKSDLPFGYHEARRYMLIAAAFGPILDGPDVARVQRLPAAVGTLAVLAELPADVIASSVRPNTTREQAEHLVRCVATTSRRAGVEQDQPTLGPKLRSVEDEPSGQQPAEDHEPEDYDLTEPATGSEDDLKDNLDWRTRESLRIAGKIACRSLGEYLNSLRDEISWELPDDDWEGAVLRLTPPLVYAGAIDGFVVKVTMELERAE